MKLPHLHNGLYTWTLVIRITRARSAARFAAARSHAAHVPEWILHVWPGATSREWWWTGISFPVTAHRCISRCNAWRLIARIRSYLSLSLCSSPYSLVSCCSGSQQSHNNKRMDNRRAVCLYHLWMECSFHLITSGSSLTINRNTQPFTTRILHLYATSSAPTWLSQGKLLEPLHPWSGL